MSSPRVRQNEFRSQTEHTAVAVAAVRLPALSYGASSLQTGLHGNAMAVPPIKTSTQPRSRDDTKKSLRSPTRVSRSPKSNLSITSINTAELERVKREAASRENSLRHQIEDLRSSFDNLKEQLDEKEAQMSQMQQMLADKDNQGMQLYERERKDHGETKKILKQTEAKLQSKTQECQTLQKETEEKLLEIQKKFEDQIAILTREKDQEILTRDQKLNKLKTQMADAMCGNSLERQQQLDELSSQLSKSQEEVETLKMKIKSVHKLVSKSGCNSCESNAEKLQDAQKSLVEKDLHIKELEELCSKSGNHLTQKDFLSKKNSKGSELQSIT